MDDHLYLRGLKDHRYPHFILRAERRFALVGDTRAAEVSVH